MPINSLRDLLSPSEPPRSVLQASVLSTLTLRAYVLSSLAPPPPPPPPPYQRANGLLRGVHVVHVYSARTRGALASYSTRARGTLASARTRGTLARASARTRPLSKNTRV